MAGLTFQHKDSGLNGFYMTEIFNVKMLVVTDEAVAEDLMVKRARHNSDRPEIRSIVDSKSTHGSMEYLPLMGKNREHTFAFDKDSTDYKTQNTGLVSVA